MEGVTLYPLKRFAVPKGDVFHALKATDEGYAGFGEVYLSHIKEGEIKGWKRHNRMTLNLIAVFGTIEFIVFDNRKQSQTFGQFKEFVLSPETNYQRLTVAPGLWFAFRGMEKDISILMNIIPEPHDSTETDNKTLTEIPYNFK
jgi:dTDP-4-dehydrorhamnose 3,5-epimerase